MSNEIRHQQQQRHQHQQQQEQLKQQQLQHQEQQKQHELSLQQHQQVDQQADGGSLTQKAEATGTVLSALFAGLTFFQDLFRDKLRKRRRD
jgi:hypothetical protein